jgi:hypothetical protein
MRQVAFEVDHLAPSVRAGWSVLVRGIGQDLTGALGPDYEQLRQRRLLHWDPSEKQHWLAIKIRAVSGRQIANPRPPVTREPPGDY